MFCIRIIEYGSLIFRRCVRVSKTRVSICTWVCVDAIASVFMTRYQINSWYFRCNKVLWRWKSNFGKWLNKWDFIRSCWIVKFLLAWGGGYVWRLYIMFVGVLEVTFRFIITSLWFEKIIKQYMIWWIQKRNRNSKLFLLANLYRDRKNKIGANLSVYY